MSKLADANPRMTPMTMCPGTLAYMPPEALYDAPVYTNKLDCFSFGVLDIQILTRQFPNPSARCKIMEIDDPRFPTGQVNVPIPEDERRRSHIDLVDPTHPLLPVVVDCLKDRDRERPSAHELCNLLAALKDTPQYGESVQQGQRATTDGERVRIRELQAEAQERQRQLQEKDRTIATKERQLQEKDRTIATRERQLRQLNQQLEANEQVTADLEQRLAAKDRQIRKLQQQTYDQPTPRKGPPSLHWSKCGRAPRKMVKRSSVVNGNMAYCNPDDSNNVYSYDSQKEMWSSLPPIPHRYSSLAVVSGLLTAIGGGGLGITIITNVTNQLLSLPGEGKWVERFPPMPTKRYGTAAVCSGKSLVVAGGSGMDQKPLHIVEVMDTESLQWSTASSLPFEHRYASATICQDQIYLLGHVMSNEPRLMLCCSMADLLQSCRSQSLGARLETLTLQEVWHRVADLPVRASSCATLSGQLLAVGGYDDSIKNYTTAIHQYNPATNSWEVISHMPTARSDTLVAVLPGNKLMVVGGYKPIKTNIVEIATLQE